MNGTSDEFWMRRALAEAERGRGKVEPNPMVGAVVVRDGRLMSVGYHDRFGGPHAEVVALTTAGENARGSTVYVTLEPCCHHGKTPPCSDAMLRAGVTRVVAAMRDPFPKVAGGGFAQLQAAGVMVEVGLLEAEARSLNGPYLKLLSTGRPWVLAKWAMTLDGKIATRTGESAWISCERSRSLVHEVRGRMDAIVVGIGTVLADDPLLTARPIGPRVATRVVLDNQARLPIESRLAQTASDVPVVVKVGPGAARARIAALQAMGCDIIIGSDDSIVTLLDELGRRGMTNVLVEGGGKVLGSCFDAGMVDEVDVFIAPIIEGGSHEYTPARGLGVARMADALRLSNPTLSVIDGDLRIQGHVRPVA